MERYAATDTPPTLTHDPDVYWHAGAWHFERAISQKALAYDGDTPLHYTRVELDHACSAKARELGWHAYHEEDEEREDDLYRYVRRTIYECPAFSRIDLLRVERAMYTLSLRPQGGPSIDLPLRRIHYRGAPAMAVLHEGILYVVLVEMGLLS